MSDNLPPEVVQQELEARFRIPTEVWTDVFKLLPRRVLVQQVAPVCFYFKEICNKNVKNVHVIEKANLFTGKLKKKADPEAQQQLEHLAANDCQLASQFKLSKVRINAKSQAILRHCPDLFDGCQIELTFYEVNKDSTLFLECLSELEEAKPVAIHVIQRVDQVVDFWHHPTFQNCTRASLVFRPRQSSSSATVISAAMVANTFEWLHHHQPKGMDCDGAADQQQVRGMIVRLIRPKHVDLLINRCSANIQQGQQPIDRRPFVLSFKCVDWPGFGQFRQIENKSTGEVLLLDRVMLANGQPTDCYRLRRCLTEGEAANGAEEEFYAGMFKPYGGNERFDIGEKKTTKVMI